MDQIQSYAYEVLVEFDKICTAHSIKYILAFGTLLGAIRHKGFIPWDDDIDVAMTRKEYLKFKEHAHELPKHFFLQTHESDPNYFLLMPKIRNVSLDLQEYAFAHTQMKSGPWIDIFIYDALPKSQDEAQEFVHDVSQAHSKLYRNVYIYPHPSDRGIKKALKTLMHKKNVQSLSSPKQLAKLENMLAGLENMIVDSGAEPSERLAPLCFYETAENYKRDSLFAHELEESFRSHFEDQQFLVPKNYDEILTRFYGDYMTPTPKEEQKSLHNYKEDYAK